MIIDFNLTLPEVSVLQIEDEELLKIDLTWIRNENPEI